MVSLPQEMVLEICEHLGIIDIVRLISSYKSYIVFDPLTIFRKIIPENWDLVYNYNWESDDSSTSGPSDFNSGWECWDNTSYKTPEYSLKDLELLTYSFKRLNISPDYKLIMYLNGKSKHLVDWCVGMLDNSEPDYLIDLISNLSEIPYTTIYRKIYDKLLTRERVGLYKKRLADIKKRRRKRKKKRR